MAVEKNFVSLRIEGTSPLIMSCPDSRLYKTRISRELEELTKIQEKKRTESMEERIKDIQFRLSLYLNQNGELMIPGMMVRAAIIAGAGQYRKKNDVKSGLIVYENPVLEYEGPKNIDEMAQSPIKWSYMTRNQSKALIINTKAKFDKWAITIKFLYLQDILDKKAIQTFADAAGIYHGIGANRGYGYGRFNADVIKDGK